MLNAAFIFIAPAADPAAHRATVKTPEITLTSIGVSTFEEGAAAAKEMVDQGCTAIELCGGFGIKGTWIVEQAVHAVADHLLEQFAVYFPCLHADISPFFPSSAASVGDAAS